MSKRRAESTAPTSRAVRCAVYTRKSSEEGLAQEFNSLDAQRESGEAYIASQKTEGWTCLPDRYDDGGFTGGNLERPGVQRLMADIEAGKIDCVVVYKVDRLSRSLMDFARMMSVFDKHGVSFVSVTQQFNTTHSMGRLTLNILLSFAQFEREIISERTRDKIAATRRKGKWAGGYPILGYDVDPHALRLTVNKEEARRVREIFDMYFERGSLIATVKTLEERGWVNKRWTTRKGHVRGGTPFDKVTLFKLLTNVVYAGKVRYKSEVHEGEHAAIVEAAVWDRVQRLLVRNGRAGRAASRNKYGALLKGLLRCKPCGCSMGHTYTSKKGSIQYRYYVCLRAQKRGWHSCPSKSVPAAEIERLVVEQVRAIGRDPALLHATLAQTRKQAEEFRAGFEAERIALQRELKRHHKELVSVAGESASGGAAAVARLSELNERIRAGEQAVAKLRERAIGIERDAASDGEVGEAMAAFTPAWETLTPKEQARVVRLLVKQVEYDGVAGTVSMTFHPEGLRGLAVEAGHKEVAA